VLAALLDQQPAHDHLLDAAHLMADAQELLGQPVRANGIALSKIHHAAFDNHLIGIDPDGRVHVSERLLMLHDGPLLEQSLKAIAGRLIRSPRSEQHHPDRDRLAIRTEGSFAAPRDRYCPSVKGAAVLQSCCMELPRLRGNR
jgi:hypothetical protein